MPGVHAYASKYCFITICSFKVDQSSLTFALLNVSLAMSISLSSLGDRDSTEVVRLWKCFFPFFATHRLTRYVDKRGNPAYHA